MQKMKLYFSRSHHWIQESNQEISAILDTSDQDEREREREIERERVCVCVCVRVCVRARGGESEREGERTRSNHHDRTHEIRCDLQFSVCVCVCVCVCVKESVGYILSANSSLCLRVCSVTSTCTDFNCFQTLEIFSSFSWEPPLPS